MEVEWTMEKTLQLIEQVEMRSPIWNFTPKDYKNRKVIQKRKDALIEVANYFHTTPKQIEHKLAILRTQYSREKIKMIKSRNSAVNEEDIYDSKWFAYKPMSFMMLQKRRNRGYRFDIGSDEMTMDETITNDDDSKFNEFKISHVESLANDENRIKLDNDDNCEPTSNRKLEEPKFTNDNFVTEPTCSSILRFSKPEVKQQFINNFEKDEFIIFGESISLQLRNLKTKYGKSLAKLNIQKAIFEAELWEEKNYQSNISRQVRSERRPSEEHLFQDTM